VTIPGPRSAELAVRLRTLEQRNVTFLTDDFPVFWDAAREATVVDVDGNEFVDCTAAFGVANAGHCNARVARAVADQAQSLMHGMGDVHPTEIRVRLFERLAKLLPAQLERFFVATTGSEAVEAALKTAMLATGRSRFAAYRGAYHGLSFGTLAVGGIKRFRAPFAEALGVPVLLHYPSGSTREDAAGAADTARAVLAGRDDVAAVIVEPIQGRAGCVVPPPGYLSNLRALCDELGIVMIVDEIFTGFGRTGDWFAIERDGVVPDILCIGKAMGSGFPISAAIGTPRVMDAWPPSTGEALHTSTYLGNPMGCAAALATIEELQRLELPARSRRLGEAIAPRLEALRRHPAVRDVRGRGLLHGVQLRDAATASDVVKRSLRAGVIFLQSGVDGDVVIISPPLVIEESQLSRALDTLERAVAECAA
jgi:4-aminobutyrate aminotransferase-like enzyme